MLAEVVDMFFFICYAEYDKNATETFFSQCPEADAAILRDRKTESKLFVISPPLNAAVAFKAQGELAALHPEGLSKATALVSRMLKAYSLKAGGLLRVRPLDPAPAELMDSARRVAPALASALEGKITRHVDAEKAAGHAGPSTTQAAIRLLCREGRLLVLPGISYLEYGGRRCMRCGATAGFTLEDCPDCGRIGCLACSECRELGPVRECGVLYAMPDVQSGRPPSELFAPILKYPLTAAQKEASDAAGHWFCAHGPQEALVWAVCGAGKTEVSFGAIAEALNKGERVLYAAPRRDVVAEIGERISSAFPAASISSFYGGSVEKTRSTSMITAATTHQALRFYRAFGLTVLDEADAFPYYGSRALEHAVRTARKTEGRTLFMSATPSRELIDLSRAGTLPTFAIPARHHGKPLPVPEVIRVAEASFKEKGGRYKCPDELAMSVAESLAGNRRHFVFVPRKQAAEQVAESLEAKLCAKGIVRPKVGWSHSADPGREHKRRAFSVGELDALVCTSIMERGVTIPGCDVTVAGADASNVFDYRALVQMAGRAGRTTLQPTGKVRFLVASPSAEVAEAVKMIEEMNDKAKSKGYLANE